MKMHTGTRTRITIDMVLDFDPTGSTLEYKVDATWHPCTWLGSPVQDGARWKQTAVTDDWFAGPGTDDGDDEVVLSLGRHFTQTRVTAGGNEITGRSEPVDVVT